MRACLGQILAECGQRCKHFGHVGHVAGPVILFQIDVDGIVAAPWGFLLFVPQSLQIGRHSRRARAADEQVTAKLEVERLQVAVVGGLAAVGAQHAVGGLRGVVATAVEGEAHPVEDGLIVVEVASQQAVAAVVGEMPGVVHGVLDVGSPLGHGVFVVSVKARLVHQVDGCSVGPLNNEAAVGALH